MPTAFVTGGDKRVGKVIVTELARVGFDIGFSYRSRKEEAKRTEKEIRNLGRRVLVLQGDIRDSSIVRKWSLKFFQFYKRCDLLINNASVFFKTPFKTIKEEEWDLILDTNLKGSYLLCKYFGDKMLEQKEGLIINIADVGGILPWSEYIAYSVSKAALIHLTKVLAKALAPGIRVNAIAPGPVLWPRKYAQKQKKNSLKKTLLNRIGSPEDVANTCFFLYKNSYITGAVIPVDGGRLLG